MEPLKLKLSLTLLLLFYGLTPGPILSKSTLPLLHEVLGDRNASKGSQQDMIHKYRSVNLPLSDASNCHLQKTRAISTVFYYGINCDGNLREGLIFFSRERRKDTIQDGFFRLLGVERIGKRDYIKISLNQSESKSLDNGGYASDIEFNYLKKPPSRLKVEKQEKIARDHLSNANLTYFRTIAFDENRRKEAPSGLEIFFDASCPLKFKEIDESFYWDNTISFVFEISCVKNSPYAILRVPGNKRNKLMASNHEAKTPEKGDSFLAKIKLRKITNEQAYWEDFKIYYE